MKQKLKVIIAQLKSLVSLTKGNYLQVWAKQPKLTVCFSLIWLLLLSVITITVPNLKVISSAGNNSGSDNLEIVTISKNTGSDNYFLEQLKLSINTTAAVYDNFVSYTPDPGGRAQCASGTTNCSFNFNPAKYLIFPSTSAQISSTQELSSILLSIVAPLGFILISMQAFNIIVTGNSVALKQLIYRSIAIVALMVITPYILSLSIIIANQLSSLILNNTSLTGFINNFIDSLEASKSSDPFQSLILSSLELGNAGGINPLSYLYALPVVLALSLVMLLLIFISFQFIIRFLNLYFLATVYPVTIIFGLHPATQAIVSTFWKQWTTFLIQQPVFIIGFVITNKVLGNLFINGVTFEGIIIFIGMLVFLSSINLLAGRLWGDAYTVISQNVTAAVAANEMKQAVIDKPLAYASQLATMRSAAGVGNTNYFNSDLGKSGDAQNEADKQKNKANSSKTIRDDSSSLTKELRGGGYLVSDQGQGKLSVSGGFYRDKTEQGETGILYTNRLDAIRDGVPAQNVSSVKMRGLIIQDASNKKMARRYNDKIIDTAALGLGHAGNTGVGYHSNDDRVQKNMLIGRSNNLRNNIQGIGVKSNPQSGDKSVAADNVIKIHVYKTYINNRT